MDVLFRGNARDPIRDGELLPDTPYTARSGRAVRCKRPSMLETARIKNIRCLRGPISSLFV